MRRIVCLVLIAATAVIATPANAEARKAPKACIQALDGAEQIRALAVEAFGAVAAHLREVSASAGRNSTNVIAFLNDITASLQTLTATVNGITTRTDPVVDAYNAAATKCRNLK